MAIFPSTAIPSGASDFTIPYSCRFEDSSSAKLTRTPGSSSNRTTWTVSFWWKIGSIANNHGGHMLAAGNTYVGMWGANTMIWNFRPGGTNYFAIPNTNFRDIVINISFPFFTSILKCEIVITVNTKPFNIFILLNKLSGFFNITGRYLIYRLVI